MPREYEIDLSGGRDAVIGLEIHVSLKSASKLFCDCSADYRNVAPNTNVCQTCLSQPGSKPFGLNEQALENGLKIALALGCKISESEMVMQRKHYWYPDLPSGYQRTGTPLAEEGELLGVRIREVHVEEDPGRYNLKTGQVDFNRSGAPLLEIVTEPDISTPEQARKFLDELQSILEYLGAAKQDAGSTRVDANVSVPKSSRVEVKNINSFKGVLTALTYELARQKNLVKNGLKVEQETRHFDEDRGITLGMRKKETVDDYRYVPDPDVLPISIEHERVSAIRKKLPELPREKRARFEKQYGIRGEEAFAICLEKEFADSFEKAAKSCDAKILAPFCRGVVRKQLNYRALAFKDSNLTPEILAKIVELITKKEVSDKVAEQLLIVAIEMGSESRRISRILEEEARYTTLPPFTEYLSAAISEATHLFVSLKVDEAGLRKMFKEILQGGSASFLPKQPISFYCMKRENGKIIAEFNTGSVVDYAKREGLLGVQGGEELDKMAEKIIADNPKAVQDFLAGNEKSLHFLAGQIMKATKGKASPQEVHAVLKKKIS